MELTHTLQHQFLIAMPSLDDSWFAKTVIYILEDNDEGTRGLVINKPHNLNIKQLLEHFHIHTADNRTDLQQDVLMGGPVDMERGFILHTPAGDWQSTILMQDDLGLTVSEDFLKAISDHDSPKDYLICLGLATWSKNQLADEIRRNSWLTAPYNASLIFETELEDRWKVALGMLGVAPEFLSSEAGNA